VEKVLENYTFTQYTKNTIVKKEDFLNELKKVQQNGYAIDNREHEDTVICYGEAFCDRQGHPLAAVSISIPSHRFPEKDVNNLVDSLNSTIDWIKTKIV